MGVRLEPSRSSKPLMNAAADICRHKQQQLQLQVLGMVVWCNTQREPGAYGARGAGLALDEGSSRHLEEARR
jgi:hypothetical protein